MKVEKHIPLPPIRQEYANYPFEEMEVGDSFFVPDMDGIMAHRLQVQISYQRHRSDKRFTSRRVADGVRVWRSK